MEAGRQPLRRLNAMALSSPRPWLLCLPPQRLRAIQRLQQWQRLQQRLRQPLGVGDALAHHHPQRERVRQRLALPQRDPQRERLAFKVRDDHVLAADMTVTLDLPYLEIGEGAGHNEDLLRITSTGYELLNDPADPLIVV